MTNAEFRKIRDRLGLTQAQLADVLGVTQNQIGKYERDPAWGSSQKVHVIVAKVMVWLDNGLIPSNYEPEGITE